MNVIDYAVILLYLLGMVWIGVVASKKVHDADDFALGGRTLSPFVITCSSIATAAGASACLGQAGKAYTDGMSALWLGITWAIGMVMLAVIAKRIYHTNATSIPDVFGYYHGNVAGRLCAMFAIFSSLATLTAQMMGMGTVIHLIIGDSRVTYELAVIIGGVITILYTLQGGFYAVAYTDTAQTIILIVSMMVVLPLVLFTGTAEIALDTMETVFTPGSFNLFHGVSFLSLAAIVCKYTFAACTSIPYIQRVLASRNEKEAQHSQIYAAIGYGIFSAVVMVMAIFARAYFPDLAQPETVLVRIIVEKFPVLLAGLGIAGFIAAVMSSVDSHLLVVSQIFSKNICEWIIPDMSQEKELKIQRISTIVAGLATLFIALQFTSVLSMFEIGATIYSSAIFFPFILSLYWKKTSAKGAIFGMVCGGLAAIIFQFVPSMGADPVILGNLISLFATVVVSLGTAAKKAKEEAK